MLYVYKNMLNGLRNELVFVLLAGMLGSLFFSRALLSVTIIVFVALSFVHHEIRSHFKNFLANPFLTGMSLLFFVPLVTGLWSEDTVQWSDMIRIKLPLFLLPLSFAGPWKLDAVRWRWLALLLICLVAVSSAWTLFHYLPESETVNQSYLESKTMLTPLGNDHVRYSFLVSFTFLLCIFLMSRLQGPGVKIILAVVAAWFALFIHILAARTGLLCFYIILAGLAVFFLCRTNKKLIASIIIVILFISPFIAYRYIPSFHNRVDFFKHEMAYFKKADYLAGGSDAIRVISIKGGWELMIQNPAGGTGFGDLEKEMGRWYELNYPAIKDPEKIYPAAEWMVYGAGAGWPGLILFWIAMVLPFFTRVKNKGWFILVNLISVAGLLFDIGLEIQFGVFIYAIVILWTWKWFTVENA